jgi:hypothetical protein
VCRSSTSSSNPFRAAAFALRVVLFALPFLALAGVIEVALYRSGESWTAERVLADGVSSGEVIFGRQYFSQQFNVFKLTAIERRRPAIVTVGSSRVMQFRAFMFEPRAAEFFNAGGLLRVAPDLAAYAELVATGQVPAPEVVIVGIDPWWISKGHSDSSWLTSAHPGDAALQFGEHVNVARAILRRGDFPWRAAILGAGTRSPGFGYGAVGLAARLYGNGERVSDGSHLYTDEIVEYVSHPAYRDREFPPIRDRVTMETAPFEKSDGIDWDAARRVVAALARLRDAGVEVYAIEPPVSDEVAALLSASPGLSRWWREYTTEFPRLFREANLSLFVAGSPSTHGLDDRYMFDGMHPGEVFVALMLEDMIAGAPKGSALAGIDARRLAARRASAAIPLAFEVPGAPGSGAGTPFP